jgi:hypothetical protein
MQYNKTDWKDHIVDGGGNVVQQGTPLSAGNLNRLEKGVADAQVTLASELAAAAAHSGVLEWQGNNGLFDSNRNDAALMTPPTAAFSGWENAMIIAGFKALVAGNVLSINGLGVAALANKVELPAPPTTGERWDLAFLESWRDATTQQWQTRLRTVEGADFDTYPEGMRRLQQAWSNAAVMAQGGNGAPITTNTTDAVELSRREFTQAGETWHPVNLLADTGLYIAGRGDDESKGILATYDGYVYALPLLKVRRRNNAGFDPDTNPNGARDCYVMSITQEIDAAGFTLDEVKQIKVVSSAKAVVGDKIAHVTVPGIVFEILSIVDATTIEVRNVSLNTSGTFDMAMVSDRPDGLYSNIIDASDLEGGDLRHLVSLTGFNDEALLEKAKDLLLRGQLKTANPTRYQRDYIGLNIAGEMADDASTLLRVMFNGTMAGTANGSAVANTKIGSGTEGFENGIQGQALKAPDYGETYSVNVPASGWTIEGFFQQGFSGNAAGEMNLVYFFAGSVDLNNRVAAVGIGTGGLSTSIWETPNTTAHNTANLSLANAKAGDWHYFKATYNGTLLTLQLDERTTSVAASSGTAATTIQINGFVTGDSWLNGKIDSVRISNVVRAGDPLPDGFSAASGDRILDGPGSDFATWGDDVGGITGVNGRANPYGLSLVPNKMAAKVALNGQGLRHYYGKGVTPGMTATTATSATSFEPTGSMESSKEDLLVYANEAADGARTTFTFTKPTSAQGINVTYYTDLYGSLVFLPGTGFASVSSATFSADGNTLTVVLNAAPANGAKVAHDWATAQRHAHFIPSVKGFLVHDWTDEGQASDGEKTDFYTNKYNVTQVNHVRVGNVMQNSGYTVSCKNIVTKLTADAAEGATTIDVSLAAANFGGSQPIRISDGAGGWVETTVVSGSGNTLTVTALTGAVKANATVEGAALITFGAAPATGTVHLVYESVYTPQLGDYLRVMYQATPYQGIVGSVGLPNLQVRTISRFALQTSFGTGIKNLTPTGRYITPITPNLPLPDAFVDASLKSDDLANAMMPTGRGLDYFMDAIPWHEYGLGNNDYFLPKEGNQFSLSSGPRNRGGSGASHFAPVIVAPLSTSVPHLTILSMLCKDGATGELYLVLLAGASTDTTGIIRMDGVASGAGDAFRLPGRPLIKNYGGVTA